MSGFLAFRQETLRTFFHHALMSPSPDSFSIFCFGLYPY